MGRIRPSHPSKNKLPKLTKNRLTKPNDDPLTPDSRISLPSMMIPGFRHTLAVERGTNKNILIVTAGGLGDVVCAEPTIRYALNNFKDTEISIGTDHPWLFEHLRPMCKKIWYLKEEEPLEHEYYVFQTLYANHFQHDFMSALQCHCVDYAMLCAFRSQLPIKDREVILRPSEKDFEVIDKIDLSNTVVIHPGFHWPTNTMPKLWWDEVIKGIVDAGATPIIIGKDIKDNHEYRGTVDVDTNNCNDMRNVLHLMETTALLQKAKVVLTNDSSPLHIAATGDAWIGFLAAAKHPDHITHWRKGQWGWRMQNLSLGGVWEIHDYCPNKNYEVHVHNLDSYHDKWLPKPKIVSDWALEKLHGT